MKNKVGAGSEKIVVLFLRGWRRVLRRQAVNIKETKKVEEKNVFPAGAWEYYGTTSSGESNILSNTYNW